MSDQPVCIADITLNDAKDVLLLLRHLAEFEELEGDFKLNLASVHELFFSDKAICSGMIARSERQPVGLCCTYLTASTFLGKRALFIEDLFVEPDFRGRGIGRQLFEACRRKAQTLRCYRLHWKALAWNEKALHFYDSLGAQRDQTWLNLDLPLVEAAHSMKEAQPSQGLA